MKALLAINASARTTRSLTRHLSHFCGEYDDENCETNSNRW